ncbi:hypothetical protein AB1Y20_002180 [Prymnesium parvum]|uniref:Thioesterase domain-containing protein n=1 Tax=Prymnesium parvum TaxID=97485 RepID=A0AB34J9M3_PRYPA
MAFEALVAELQVEFFADDLDPPPGAEHWSAADLRLYYETGGAHAPTAEHALLDEWGSERWTAAVQKALPAVGQGAWLPGEEAGRRRGCGQPNPEARVRLYLLYGVADVSLSLQKFVAAAPPWVEVRLVEFGGHGFRSKEPLSPAADSQPQLTVQQLQQQRADFIAQLADDIEPTVGGAPYALYGFSFGALVAYELALELQRRALSPPLLLAVAGRGAPHCVSMGWPTISNFAALPAKGVLDWMRGLGFNTSNIPQSMHQRAASLFRMGMILGAMPSGSSEKPTLQASLNGTTVEQKAQFPHTDTAACVGCKVLAFGSDADTIWPAVLVPRWQDVTKDGFRFTRFQDVEHHALMCHRTVMAQTFGELAVATARLLDAMQK